MPNWIKYGLLGVGIVALAVAATVITNVLMAPMASKNAAPQTAAPEKGKDTPVVVKGEPAPIAPTKYVLVLEEGESKKKSCVIRVVGVEFEEVKNLAGNLPHDVIVDGDKRTYPKHKFRDSGTASGTKVTILYNGIINWTLDMKRPKNVQLYYGKLPE